MGKLEVQITQITQSDYAEKVDYTKKYNSEVGSIGLDLFLGHLQHLIGNLEYTGQVFKFILTEINVCWWTQPLRVRFLRCSVLPCIFRQDHFDSVGASIIGADMRDGVLQNASSLHREGGREEGMEQSDWDTLQRQQGEGQSQCYLFHQWPHTTAFRPAVGGWNAHF